ncbi:MAG: phage tail tape measure protein [Proteobacteria bacterium]|nr:phage tail tape measure protein [Pseudomonadota bacterium]
MAGRMQGRGGQSGDDDALAAGGLEDSMKALDASTQQFGRSLSRALAAGIVQGKSFDDVLKGLGQKLLELSLRAAFKPLESGFGSLFSGLFGAGGSLFGATGGGGGFGTLSTLFGASSAGAPQAGFASPAAMSPAATFVTMNVTSPDAESFRRSEVQVSAALARAVGRGQRGL